MTCPYCKEEIADGSFQCEHCDSMLHAHTESANTTIPPVSVKRKVRWLSIVVFITSLLFVCIFEIFRFLNNPNSNKSPPATSVPKQVSDNSPRPESEFPKAELEKRVSDEKRRLAQQQEKLDQERAKLEQERIELDRKAADEKRRFADQQDKLKQAKAETERILNKREDGKTEVVSTATDRSPQLEKNDMALPRPPPHSPSARIRERSETPSTPDVEKPTSNRIHISDNLVVDFVEKYLAIMSGGNISQILDLYDDHVSFMGKGIVAKRFIQQDKEDFYHRWPYVKRSLKGVIQVRDGPQAGSKQAAFSTHFSVYSPQRGERLSGNTTNILILSMKDGVLKIIDDKEQVLSRERNR